MIHVAPRLKQLRFVKQDPPSVKPYKPIEESMLNYPVRWHLFAMRVVFLIELLYKKLVPWSHILEV